MWTSPTNLTFMRGLQKMTLSASVVGRRSSFSVNRSTMLSPWVSQPHRSSGTMLWHRQDGSKSLFNSCELDEEHLDALSQSINHTPKRFRLSPSFIDNYKTQTPPFGFNGLGQLVYYRTYSRLKDDGTNEAWWETVERVVNGTYNMQKRWIEQHGLGWNPWRAQRSAQEMFDRIFNMKFLPPGRGLWAMGSPITEEKGLFAALNNCAFVSTDGLGCKVDPVKPFVFLMDAALLGVGVGFDTKGAGKVHVKGPSLDRSIEHHVIEDSREGWVGSTRLLLESYLGKGPPVSFDYSLIRPQGSPIKGFGGLAAGPEALRLLHESVREILDRELGSPISVTAIVDIMNLIGRCVVTGNVRQTAEIAFGDPSLDEYIDLKDYDVNPRRQTFGWTSNNSVFADIGMDYTRISKRIQKNGEPGIAWLENMQNYGRMNGSRDNKDSRAAGGNPCLEQTLESYELCCLVETFPHNHESMDDFKKTLKYAYLYAKTVTLGKTGWAETNRVMLRNRRIGCSVSGIAQFVTNRGLEELRHWLSEGYDCIQEYDKQYSEWFAIPRSIKTTSVKPSGTVSLLAGATPGMHYPESRFYLRRIRVSKDSDLLPRLKEAGFVIEPAAEDPNSKFVVEIPCDAGEGIRTAKELSMWEQLSIAAFLQKYWSDNQVSCTVTFDPETEGSQIPNALDYFQYQLKGVSFLPRLPLGAYEQMPYEEISEKCYRERVAALKPVHFQGAQGQAPDPERFCDGDVCSLPNLPPGGSSEASRLH